MIIVVALKYYFAARKVDPRSPETFIGEADLYLETSNFAGAETAVRAGIAGGAADTIVALNETVFGKPCDRDDARRIISALSGTRHEVITGVTLLDGASGRRITRHDRTIVVMRALGASELDAYLETGAWADKAGAYGIQDRADAFVDHIEGSFSNVVGFPMALVTEMLESFSNPCQYLGVCIQPPTVGNIITAGKGPSPSGFLSMPDTVVPRMALGTGLPCCFARRIFNGLGGTSALRKVVVV